MSKEKWLATMVKKYGSEEAVREEMTKRAIFGGKVKVPKGFAKLDEQRLKEMSAKGVEARRAK